MSNTFDSMMAEAGLSGITAGSAILVAIGTTLISFLLCSLFLILMPRDYFSLKRHPPTKDRTHWQGTLKVWLRNIGGILLIIVGAILSIPGIPFPGTILVLIGFSITDFKAKRNWQQRFLKRPRVQGRINTLRKRFGKPPILLGC